MGSDDELRSVSNSGGVEAISLTSGRQHNKNEDSLRSVCRLPNNRGNKAEILAFSLGSLFILIGNYIFFSHVSLRSPQLIGFLFSLAFTVAPLIHENHGSQRRATQGILD